MFEDNCMKDEDIRGFNVPVELNCLFGNIRYRYQKAKGFLFRLGISPKFDLGDKNGIGSYVDILSIIPYLSFGYSF